MKKYTRFLLGFAMVALCFAIPTFLHAQDSTAVAATSGTVSIIETIFSALALKFPILTTIGSILFFLSEGLSLIPAVKANGVFQLVANALSALFKKPS